MNRPGRRQHTRKRYRVLVETAMFRFKHIVGREFRARSWAEANDLATPPSTIEKLETRGADLETWTYRSVREVEDELASIQQETPRDAEGASSSICRCSTASCR